MIETADEKRLSRRKSYTFWAGLAVTGVCFYLILRNIQWGEFLATLAATNWLFLILGAVSFGASFVARALRWQSLLSSRLKIAVWDSYAYVMIGYLANLFLPLRAGEVFRLMLLGREKNVDASFVLATLVLERLFDVVSLLVFVVILALAMDIPAEFRNGIFLVEGAAVVTLVVLMVLSFRHRDFAWAERLLPGFVPDAVRTAGLALLRSFVDGLAVLTSWRQFLLVLFYSVIDWMVVAISTYSFMLAAGLSLTWSAPLFVLVVANLGAAVVSAPGGFGVIHFLTIVALGVYSVSRGTAFGFSVLWHETIVIVEMAIGFVCLWAKGLSLRQMGRREAT